MTAVEPIQAGPYPTPSDAPDGPNQMAAIVSWAVGRLNMRFASVAARDAAITSPVEGMQAVTGTGTSLVQWIYQSGAWRDAMPPIVSWVPGGDINCASGGTVILPSTAFPALPRATRIIVQIEGAAGFAGAVADVDVTIIGSHTVTQSASHQVPAATGKWTAVNQSGYMDVPANTSATMSAVSLQSIANVWYSVSATYTRVAV